MQEDHTDTSTMLNGAPSFAGSRITLLAYDRDGQVLNGQNVPDGLSLDSFASLVRAYRLSGISGRNIGDLIHTLAEVGGTIREQCMITAEGFTARYDIDLWRQEDGNVGVLLVDVTGKDRESSNVRSLSLELAHRTKNILAVVLSLANQTARRTNDYEGFKARFFAHVDALSSAHDVIAATGWQGANVRNILDKCVDTRRANLTMTVKPHADRVTLKPNAVQNIAIVMRELQDACEASDTVSCDIEETEEGAVDLNWLCKGQHDRCILWEDMLCRYAPTSLEGKGDIDFCEDGFRYHLVIGKGQRTE